MNFLLSIVAATLNLLLLQSAKVVAEADSDSEIGEYDDQSKYMVAIYKEFNDVEGPHYLCHGAIIDDFHVITAAQCVHGISTHELLVLTNPWETRQFDYDNVVESTVHPKYNPNLNSHFNNLAILQVEKGFDNFVNTKLYLPHYGDVIDWQLDTCKIVVPDDGTVTRDQKCVTPTKDSFLGWLSRTGGPLVDEFDHIVGILIEEKKDDSEKRTALFTRVASFMKFIDKVLRDASKKRICTENDLPMYVVSIEKILDDGTQRLCGGAIIDKFHVITAAHCVYGYNTSQLFIRTHRMYKNLCHHEITENFVEKTKWHPRYKNSSARSHLYDIAVLKVTKAFDLDSKHVRILNLPSKNKREENSTIVRFTGFRRNYASCITFGSMLMPLKKCKKYRPVTATNSHVCTKPEDNIGYGWIDNDGGPLVDINNNIIGIRIRPKNSHKLPALYTKVAFFMRFIKKVLRRNY